MLIFADINVEIFQINYKSYIYLQNACTALTALMHYFFLAAFCLMLAEGIDILISVVIVFSATSKLKWLLLMGWGASPLSIHIAIHITICRC